MEYEIKQHESILLKDVLRAISIKNNAWPFPVESQIKWILDNMFSEDFHVFLTDEGKDKAYMTLSPVEGKMNGITTVFLGVGCVCTSSKGEGYGGLLLRETNRYLLENGIKGLLFCKKSLIPFYEKYDWAEVPHDKVIVSPKDPTVFTMVYNCPEIESLEYSGRLF